MWTDILQKNKWLIYCKKLLNISGSLKSQIAAAAAAGGGKSLQSCPTLCNPIDGSPPGSPVPGILQARTLEWVAISFSNAWKWKVKVKSLSCVQLLVTPWTAAYQAPLSMGFARQEYWVPIKWRIFSSYSGYTRCPLEISGKLQVVLTSLKLSYFILLWQKVLGSHYCQNSPVFFFFNTG